MKRQPTTIPKGWDLVGLSAIADVLGLTVEELEKREKGHEPPPIGRYMGRPIARRRDLEAWLRAHPNERRTST